MIGEPELAAEPLAAVADVWIATGDLDKAEQVADSIDHPASRAKVLASLEPETMIATTLDDVP